jgi:hypothetical protein
MPHTRSSLTVVWGLIVGVVMAVCVFAAVFLRFGREVLELSGIEVIVRRKLWGRGLWKRVPLSELQEVF